MNSGDPGASGSGRLGPWRVAGAVLLVVAAIQAGCLSVFGDFFFIDDAQTEFLPFYREMGRIWLSGELPLLSTRTWQGGNFLVDMVVSPFAPQTIVTGITAALFEAQAVAVAVITTFNLALIIASGWWLGRLQRLDDRWSLLVGFLLATQPVFLYVLAANWWNSANAYAWFLFSVAALLHLRASPGRGAFAAALGGACALFACASAQYQLAYGLVAAAAIAIDFAERRDVRFALGLSLVPACAILIAALPLMSEYLAVGDWLPRVSGMHNRRSLLVPHWGMVLHAFNPFYGSHMSWWEGPLYMPVSLGYSTVLVFFALAYFRPVPVMAFERRLLLAWAVIGLLLAMAPAQVGPIRVPYRVLPVLASAIILFAVQRVALGRLRIDRSRALAGLGFAVLAALLVTFSADAELRALQPLLRLQMTLALLGGGVIGLVYLASQQADGRRWFRWAAWLSGAAWFGGILLTPTLAGVTFPYSELPEPAAARPSGRAGFMLGLCGKLNDPVPPDLHALVAGEFLLFGQPSINGYSPVGHKGFMVLFPHSSMHTLYWPRPTLVKIARPIPELPGLYLHQLFRISDVVACEQDIDDRLQEELEAAGLRITRQLPGKKVLIQPVRDVASTDLLPTAGAAGVKPSGAPRMLEESFDVDASRTPRDIYFSRLYWPGYHATLEDEPLRVEPFMKALVKVTLPAGRSGHFVLRYEPSTWRWSRWALLLGLVLAAATTLLWRFPATRR